MVFPEICVRTGIFLKMLVLDKKFCLTSSILDLRNCMSLDKSLQRIMVSSSCTTKGMLPWNSHSRERLDLGSICLLKRVGAHGHCPSMGVHFLGK